jgi:hypothetical protein
MPLPTLSPSALTFLGAKHLMDLCQEGRLYEVEEWIASGKSLQVPPESRETPLQIAMNRGFHSLVLLLARNDVGQAAKDDALSTAVSVGNLEFVELLVKHGVDLSSVPFSEVLLNWKPSVIQFFLDRGADFVTNRPFTKAFVARIRTALRPYLECKRNHPELAKELQRQADAALRHFCQAGNEKWISLMLWLGADPRAEGPGPDDPDDPEYYTTALRQAGYKANIKILKLLKLRPETDNIAALVHDAAMFGGSEVVSYLLGLGTNLNDKPNGGSSALDGAFWHLGFDRVWPFHRYRQRPLYELRASLEVVQNLCEHGALWRPNDAYALNSLRRNLFACEPAVTTELVRILRKHEACTDEIVQTLLRTPRMRQHLAAVQSRLSRQSANESKKPAAATPDRASLARPPRTSSPPSPSYQLLRKYNRDVLYDEVWKQPVWTLAKKYGISDVGLAKACRKLGVPLPGLGYWAKKTAGKKVPKRPPLPPLSANRGSS